MSTASNETQQPSRTDHLPLSSFMQNSMQAMPPVTENAGVFPQKVVAFSLNYIFCLLGTLTRILFYDLFCVYEDDAQNPNLIVSCIATDEQLNNSFLTPAAISNIIGCLLVGLVQGYGSLIEIPAGE